VEELLPLLSVHSVSNVRQIQIHTAELLLLDPSPSEVKTATAKFKTYELSGSIKFGQTDSKRKLNSVA
jgi:hypothetical protein